jgi:hypothetical protein
VAAILTMNPFSIMLETFASTGVTMERRRSLDPMLGRNQSLANWVHYIMKRKALGVLPDHRVGALHGSEFEWTTGQSTRTEFEDWFAQLEDFKQTHGTVGFFGEDKK